MASGSNSPGSRSSGSSAALDRIVAEVVTAAGFDLEDLSVSSAGRRRAVRVIIDSDQGVDLDRAADISRELSERLDALDGPADPLGGQPYTLEVTSPGIGRPLTAPRHFRRAAGRLLVLALADGSELTARVLRAGDTEVELLTGRDGTIPRTLRYDEIARAKVEVEFNPPSAAVRELLAGVGIGVAESDGGDGDLDEDLEEDDLEEDDLEEDDLEEDDDEALEGDKQ